MPAALKKKAGTKAPKRRWYLSFHENATWTFDAVHGPYPSWVAAVENVIPINAALYASDARAEEMTLDEFVADMGRYESFSVHYITKKEAKEMASEGAIWPPEPKR